MRKFAETKYPGVLSTMEHMEHFGDVEKPHILGEKEFGVTAAMNLSVNLLMNATYYSYPG